MGVTTEVTTIVIKLQNGTVNFNDTETSAETVGELREELGLTGSISVAEIIAVDSTSLSDGVMVSHVPQGVKGGQ
jgi:hypothetical protein|tara:strand:+ start:126 stop:350 length:225 start_codon:yes stop_codon:yes gene_type:complete